jgi:sRNA-binding carbon storage regulator CsrA
MDHKEKVGRLVLTRNWGESVKIGHALVTCEPGKGDRVSLMIEAPRSVPVFRTEVLERQKRGTFQVRFQHENFWTTYRDATQDDAVIAHSKTEFEPFRSVKVFVRDVDSPSVVLAKKVHFATTYGVEDLDND